MIAAFCWTSLIFAAMSQSLDLASPDGQVAVQLQQTDSGGLRYSVRYNNKPVITTSRLGLVLKDAPPLVEGFQVINVTRSKHDQTWKPVYGERSEVRDRYHELVVELQEKAPPMRRIEIVVRAYDEGAALCYRLPEQPNLTQAVIAAETTEFCFAGDYPAWPVYSAQGVYQRVRLSQNKPNCERPLVVEVDRGPFVAVAEAHLVDYARMRLMPVTGNPHAVQSQLGSEAVVSLPYRTPWRVIMLGDTPGQLLERNDLILNLNDPCAIADTSWIKPGKVIREVTLTTAGGKACIDFCVARGLQYIEFDAGWYGNEYDDASDARKVNRDAKKSGAKGDLDLLEVICYGQERGIGVFLYVNRRALERQLDELLPLYQQWGVKGVKYGFVNVGSQQWTTWLHEAVRKAAAHRLMVDVHDEYRPTGYSRTYPNLLTQEGVHGNECMPSAEHNAILPFTRFLCGAADYTVCWHSDRIKTSRAHQLALPVAYYSPLQFLFWYDRPQQFGNQPELDFFRHVPVVWDDTRVIHGVIGQYATIARRSGDDWFVGSINAVERRKLDIPLRFLSPGRKYTAEIYSDADPSGGDSKKVGIERFTVDSTNVITADMAANGGHAVRLTPCP